MAEAAVKTVKISQGHLECPICCSLFKETKMLDCPHNFCLSCLEEMIITQRSGTEKIPCPVCKRETRVPEGGLQSLSSTFFLSSLVDEIKHPEEVLGEASLSSATCGCGESKEATWRCVDCRDNLCRDCWKAHRRFKVTKDHQIISLEDGHKSKIPPAEHSKRITRMCTTHNDHPLCLYCEKCDALICSMCVVEDHRSAEHKILKIDDCISSFRSKVDNIIKELKELKFEPAKDDPPFIGVRCQDVVSDADLGEVRVSEKWQLKEEFGKEGTGNGEFNRVVDAACFRNGDIAVADTVLKRLSLLSSTGRYKNSVTERDDRHQLDAPRRVAVTDDDLLFVTYKKKVKVFKKELQFVREFTPSADDAEGLPKSDLRGIAVDKQRVAVADYGRGVISVHNLDGSLISSISNDMAGGFLAISNKDRLIFTNWMKKRLLCVDFKGNEVFNVRTLLNGGPANPTGVLCDDDGNIYVGVWPGDCSKAGVNRYDSNGAIVASVAHGYYCMACGMAFTPAGDVAVADTHSVKIFERTSSAHHCRQSQ